MVVALLFISSLFAVAGYGQAFADEVDASPSVIASPSPGAEEPTATPVPTPSASATEPTTLMPTPIPTPTPTIDPMDAVLYKDRALAKEKRARKAWKELTKRAKALGKKPPKLLPRSSFGTWKQRLSYYDARVKASKGWRKYYWNKLVKPSGIGVNRWKPLLRYCGMPGGQMQRALSCMWNESNGNPRVDSNWPYVGLYQFHMDWWWDYDKHKRKWNPYDPYQNVLHFVKAILVPGGWGHWAATA
jgi:hypothetical protein